ncbi:phage tail-collar fiber domain-containing protein, partial [Clostridioides difficile]
MAQAQYYTLLTEIGKAAIANATALGTRVDFAKIKVGDGGGSAYIPTETQTELKNV